MIVSLQCWTVTPLDKNEQEHEIVTSDYNSGDKDDEEVKSLVTAWRLSRLVSSIGQATIVN